MFQTSFDYPSVPSRTRNRFASLKVTKSLWHASRPDDYNVQVSQYATSVLPKCHFSWIWDHVCIYKTERMNWVYDTRLALSVSCWFCCFRDTLDMNLVSDPTFNPLLHYNLKTFQYYSLCRRHYTDHPPIVCIL